jgi:hypothetical protein
MATKYLNPGISTKSNFKEKALKIEHLWNLCRKIVRTLVLVPLRLPLHIVSVHTRREHDGKASFSS